MGKLALTVAAILYGMISLAIALSPAIAFFSWFVGMLGSTGGWSDSIVQGLAGVLGFAIFGFSLMALAIVATRLLPKIQPGSYPVYSLVGFQWFFNGILPFLVSKIFLDFLLLTGLNTVYFRFMGARIGKRVQMNTKDISDFHLLEIGDDAIIGGQSTIIGHVAEKGRLILSAVKIGSHATIGFGAMIYPGAQIGDYAVVGAKALVSKGQKIPPSEIYAGIPAKKIRGK